ncbi:hypothetical protein SADUNF_Sadunf09G0107200 [Salix dunnii]|uniref:Uncharacterized protein n=1 Tax=Salix dunnii TaxID=1413687 RepID=A0A835JYC0_9ROSI|nr:hypothetical protein SADUNF_Sadunf09G0107200 [Salix dunnii]
MIGFFALRLRRMGGVGFHVFVFYSSDGQPRIDWTHFNPIRSGYSMIMASTDYKDRDFLCDISELNEIRKITNCQDTLSIEETECGVSVIGKGKMDGIRDGEKFDFCMCNPPFFEAMEEAGLNPKTSFAGTPEEMVCPGGEKAFITHIIEDSVVLKESSRCFSSVTYVFIHTQLFHALCSETLVFMWFNKHQIPYLEASWSHHVFYT